MAVVAGTFPGIAQIVRIVATKSNGVLPGVAQVYFLPQATSPSSDGTLVIAHGSDYVSWQQARLDKGSIRFTTNGHLCVATIYDRRFWWVNTIVHGQYNVRDANGEIIAATEKTPQELAAHLLDQMGEFGYDISALPNDTDDRPFVDWSCAWAAGELYRLCADRGCEPDLSLMTNSTRIVRLGEGATIPSTDVQSVSFGFDLGDVPAVLRVCTAETLWQLKFKMNAMAIDPDGQVVEKADADYAPAGGWDDEIPDQLLPEEDEDVRELANSSVYHLFEVGSFADGTNDLPGTELTLPEISQCFPLNRTLLESYTNGLSGKRDAKSAYLEGKFFPHWRDVQALANTDAVIPYSGQFSLFPETGRVLTAKSLYRQTEAGYEDPELYLVTSCNVRNADDNQYVRYVYDYAMGGYGIFPLPRPELVRTIRAVYETGDPTAIDSIEDNQDQIDAACQVVIEAAKAKYQTQQSLDAVYRGIIPIDTDGVNRQVSWTVSTQGDNAGAHTRISQNCETSLGMPKARERARIIQIMDEDFRGDVADRRYRLMKRRRGDK
ncbi:hypothetical protein [Planctomicrobium piriforme]|uniref:Uncharacterized protein n=1 Tax=Planctomicrobium piriforme TaxID=1576369 RepID=A0A1I3EBK5_9PLAN|nr:hypothetical protein [Planctomicrobium piriforme]SFH96362.1 hypothetical protein SAMN05421753_104154 [Planctomicrobium piriforme]